MENNVMNIPEQLQNKEFKFCLVRPTSKLPFEKNWQEKGYIYDDSILIAHINNGGNYGVIGGYGNLVVVDFDNQEFQDKMISKMPKTFGVKTGSGKMHLYYICDKTQNRKIMNDKKGTLADIQGDKRQVIAPNSTHPNGNKYTVGWDFPIAKVQFSELLAIFSEYLPMTKVVRKEFTGEGHEITNQIKNKITVADVLSEFGINTNKNPTDCPFHSSSGGKCLSFTNELWHCFHCEQSGDVFTLMEKKNNYSFKESVITLAKKVGLEEQLKQANIFSFKSKKDDTESFEAEELADDILQDITIMTLRDNFEMFYYDDGDGIYHPEAEALIGELAKERVNDISIHQLNEVKHHIRYSTLKKRSDIGKNKYKIHLSNGIFDLSKMELIPFNPEDISLSRLPVKYVAGGDCPNFKKFVSEIMVESDVPLIQEFLGYCLWRDYHIQKAFMLIGEGRNGKSVLCSVIQKFLGEENVCAVSLQELELKFSTAYFFNKLANIHSDVPARPLSNTGKFKMLTGGDKVVAEAKGKMGFLFTNYAKMIFSCNQLPEVNDNTMAFFRRWIILNFPNIFEEGKADTRLINKLVTEEEISGIFNWAITGLERLLKNEKFSYNVTPEEIGIVYQRMADSLFAFVSDCLEISQEETISKAELYDNYTKYCKKFNLPIKTKTSVSQQIGRHIPATEVRSTNKERAWYGIKFKIEDVSTIPLIFGKYQNNADVSTIPLISEKNNWKTVIVDTKKQEKSSTGNITVPVEAFENIRQDISKSAGNPQVSDIYNNILCQLPLFLNSKTEKYKEENLQTDMKVSGIVDTKIFSETQKTNIINSLFDEFHSLKYADLKRLIIERCQVSSDQAVELITFLISKGRIIEPKEDFYCWNM